MSSHNPNRYVDASNFIENILNPSLEPHGPGQQSTARGNQQRRNQAPTQSHAQKKTRHPLVTLVYEEEYLKQRKAHIASFGSSWVRPPGVLKTKQAMDDEEAELREQERAASREAALAEARAAQEASDLAAAAEAARAGGTGGDAAAERDLDEDIPDAPSATSDEEDMSDDENDISQEGNTTGFDGAADYATREAQNGSGSFPQTFAAAAQAYHPSGDSLDGTEDIDLDMDRDLDLDDDIPDAGSYEHTDTDYEEESTQGFLDESSMGPPLQMDDEHESQDEHPHSHGHAHRSGSPLPRSPQRTTTGGLVHGRPGWSFMGLARQDGAPTPNSAAASTMLADSSFASAAPSSPTLTRRAGRGDASHMSRGGTGGATGRRRDR